MHNKMKSVFHSNSLLSLSIKAPGKHTLLTPYEVMYYSKQKLNPTQNSAGNMYKEPLPKIRKRNVTQIPFGVNDHS